MRSFAHQTFHYLSRPHQSPRRTPVTTREAWTTYSLKAQSPYVHVLTVQEREACIRSVKKALEREPNIRRWTRKTLQIEALVPNIDAWRAELDGHGRGFQVVRGIPVEELGSEGSEAFFWGLGLLLGVPGAQNTDGDLIGHVVDRRDNSPSRLYRTSQKIGFHCDTADVVGLLCLSTPRTGGESRIASSLAVYNALLEGYPNCIDRLYAPFATDAHGQRGMPYMYTYCARHARDRLRIFYHSDYFRTGTAKALGTCDPETLSALNAFDKLARSPELCLKMNLEIGDAQFVSNHSVVHAREGYVDSEDGGKCRHLLRLWLSLPPEKGVGRLRTAAWASTLSSAGAAIFRGLAY